MPDFNKAFMSEFKAKNPGEPEFHQAGEELLKMVRPVLDRFPEYRHHKILERFLEPERVILFRVCWLDDRGAAQINRGFLVQLSSALGPYKSALRFHPSVTLGIMKSMALEQVLKNSLSAMPLGGGFGGADFNPKGRSDGEIMRFCYNFMAGLYHYIGPAMDIPGGDLGVGGREIGYLFGQYKRLSLQFNSALTGKGMQWGGSTMRPEAAAFGCVYFAAEMLAERSQKLDGKKCLVSGSGLMAQFIIEKLLDLGAKPVTVSDSNGFIYDEAGIDLDKLNFLRDLKNYRRGRLKEYADKFKSSIYTASDAKQANPALWAIPAQCAFPAAGEHDICESDAKLLVQQGIILVAEAGSMAVMPDAANVFNDKGVLFAPSRATTIGSTIISGLEISQNSMAIAWTRDDIEYRLRLIIRQAHQLCADTARRFGNPGNYGFGASLAGFVRVADAMLDQGLV